MPRKRRRGEKVISKIIILIFLEIEPASNETQLDVEVKYLKLEIARPPVLAMDIVSSLIYISMISNTEDSKSPGMWVAFLLVFRFEVHFNIEVGPSAHGPRPFRL